MMQGERQRLDYRIEGNDKVRRTTAQFALLGGGIAWLFHFMAIYLVGEFGCLAGWGKWVVGGLTMVAWLILLFTVLFAALAAAATFTAVRMRNKLQDATGDTAVISAENKSFIARTSVITNGIFLYIILVQTIPVLYFLRAC